MNKWMKIAYDEATIGMLTNEGGPFGAVIVKDEIIIAKAHNRVLLSKDPTAHAEVNAIRLASKKLDSFDLSGCTLYTTCMPCPMCLGAIMWARISNVYYGATEEDAKKGGFDDLHFYELLKSENKGLNLKQIDKEENASLFDKWNEKENRVIY
ncbi:MAG: nucleoside deaminase [Epsilonproteobacteria bacterium]|nr:MAG: nucleoside deaminase [Campylobacterota bacterium]